MRRFMIRYFLFIVLLSMVNNQWSMANDELPDPKPGPQEAWQQLTQPTLGWGSIDVRYSRSQVPTTTKESPLLRAWRGERVSAQAVLATPKELGTVSMTVSDLKNGKHVIPASAVRKYFVRYVLTDIFKNRKDSFLLADRLDPVETMKVEANTARPIWFDIHVPADAKPGTYQGTITVTCDGMGLSLPIVLQVANRVLPASSEWAFHLDLWQNPYAVARYYDVPLWSQQHFDLMRPTMELLAAAGQKVITCSVISRPWNGQTFDPFESMIAKMKRLDGSWKYDYTVFDKWVEFMMSCGITEQIDCYTLVPWHYRFDYYDCATNRVKEIACKPGEAKYHDFIVPFLKDFSRHLREKGWFSRTYIAMDERPTAQMEAAWQTIQDADPEFKIEGAANYSVDSEAADRVDDISVGFQYNLIKGEALARRAAKGQKITFYTCCGPERPNTFTFSPPAESAYLGWHAIACDYNGYLRWAYNSWNKQPNQDSRFGNWPAGDCYLVYPGGSSIRFERLVEGIQAYEKVRLLRKDLNLKGAKQVDEMLRYFAPNTYEEDKDPVALLRQANDLLWKLSSMPEAKPLASPNGKITLEANETTCVVKYMQKQVLKLRLPLTAENIKAAKSQRIKDDYTMLAGKRLHCINEANEYVFGTLVLRLYNDGIAFRTTNDNPTASFAYIIPEGTRRWAQQWSDGYEGFYPLTITSKSNKGNRWGYPLLIEPSDNIFALITEANIEKGQSASCLYSEGDTYRVVPDETIAGKAISRSPWRVAIIGSLADVVQSTLVTDVSDACRSEDTSWIQPGVVSWVYWANNHGSNDYNIIKKYSDFAATLHLPYVLIDAEWDEMKDGKTVEDAVSYAKSIGVKPMIWYNSSVGWINGAPGPKFRLNKPEDREKEFAWCEKIGVAGVKVDFFSGDNQKNMDYCIELMECAARHHLLINFHGATIPRGWQRTYPNLLSTEGVYGAEWYNNVPTFTNRAARHNATLPFTRNVIGPMDYTPCAFSDSQHPHITTHAHELALTVLFESGLQHLADRPESFLAQPREVQDFLSQLPTVWDETRFVIGYPGESVVLARRKSNVWYVAGINGTDEPQTLTVPLDFIKGKKLSVTRFEDSGKKDAPWNILTATSLPETINCQPRGGFLWVCSQ